MYVWLRKYVYKQTKSSQINKIVLIYILYEKMVSLIIVK